MSTRDQYIQEQLELAGFKAREGIDFVIGAWELDKVGDKAGMNILSILRDIENALGNIGGIGGLISAKTHDDAEGPVAS